MTCEPLAGLLTTADPWLRETWPAIFPCTGVLLAAVAALYVPIFWLLAEGVVLTTDDLLCDGAETAALLDAAPLAEDEPADACTRLAELLPAVLVFLLIELLVPMPPLSVDPLPKTLSDV